ncbi:hypothetical protein Q8F57_018495 [Paraburkholderia terrae]|uniref:hypothetical protein n=1 Tax=Paraburkholderia terrae TaxID=311230 RepID=UPI00296B0A4A|nr:hypothetical protein [Paraburkholderia terrae]MDW3655165.1 hypothetical protein [Paraburkholderia terrae]
MNRFSYRAYYEFNGSREYPFRSKKTDQEIEEAVLRFPVELEQYLDKDSTVQTSASQPGAQSCDVTIVTDADESTTDDAIKKCLNSLDLFGKKL